MKHFCSKCARVELKTTITKGIEIDYCPDCNGIWFDNGELKKLISQYTDKAKEDERVLQEMKLRMQARERFNTPVSDSRHSKAKSLVDILLEVVDFS